MKYTLSKKIVHKIIKEEIKKTGIKVKVSSYTNLETFINVLSIRIAENSQNKLSYLLTLKNIIEDIKEYKGDLGIFLKETDEIKIFLTNIRKDNYTKKEYLYDLLLVTYHEYKHVMFYKEDWKQRDDLINFYLLIDALTWDIAEEFYDNNHNDFYEEIIADKYGIKKTNEFLYRHPTIYKELELYIEYKNLENEIYYQNYDVQLLINYLDKSIKNNLTKLINKINENSLVAMIFEKTGSFKNIKDILIASTLSKEMKFFIVSSNAYLKEINYNNLTTKELIFILNSLKFTYNKELLRYKNNQKLKDKINNFNIKVAHSKEIFEYNSMLFPLINKKQKITKNKIRYLKIQIEKIQILLKKKEMSNNLKKLKQI